MAGKYVLGICTVFLGISCAWAQERVYQCTDDKGHVTLQDKQCVKEMNQTIIKIDTANNSVDETGAVITYDGLRKNELALLEQFHALDLQREKYQHIGHQLLALQAAQFKNEKALEEQKHQHALEMFDKSYRHLYVYGAANRDNVSFPFSYGNGSLNCQGGDGGIAEAGGLGGIGGIGCNASR